MRARSMRTVAVVLALLLAALAAWWFTSRADDPPRASPGADRVPAPDPAPLPVLEPQPHVTPPAEPSSTTPAWAFGVVVDEVGAPIVGARVLARTRRELGGRRVAGFLELHEPPLSITGADGRFRVEHAPAHFEALAVLADGFEAMERPDLATGAGASHDLKITLSRGRRLVGSIRDTEGRPISGARVSLTARSRQGGWVPPLSALTDREGAYAFLGLPQVLDRCMVGALGYQSSNGFLDASAWGERKDFTLMRSALLVDAVEAEGGAPIIAARGTVWLGRPGVRSGVLEPWRHRDEPPSLWPDAPGRLELHLDWVYPPLTHQSLDGEVVVFAEGHKSARARLTLQKGVEPPHLRVALARGEDDIALGGVVVEGKGARITVLLAGPKDRTTMTDEELPVLRTLAAGPGGRFAVRGLPADRYRLRVELAGRAPVTVEAEAPALDLVIAFVATGRLEARLLSVDGTPQVGAEVAAEPAEGRTVLSARTGADGVARFEDVPAGALDVAPGRAPPSLGALARHPGHVRVVVEAGATARVDLVLPSRLPRALRVVDERGRGVEGATLRLEGHGYGGVEGEWDRVKALAPVTDADGRCAVDLFPGTYRCVLTLPSGTRTEFRVEVGARPGPEQVLRVTLEGVTLRGRVLEEGAGGPVVGRPVFVLRASPDARDRLGSAVTDDEGRFVIVGLPAERLRVHLSLRGQGERGWADDESPWPSAMAEIDLSAAAPAELVARVPRIQGPGAIERTVTLALHATAARDGKPLEGASGYAQVLRNGLWITAGDAKTDATGRGEARLVPGERYRVYVSGRWSPKPPRWKGREVEVVPANARIEVDVALEPDEG